MKKVFIKKFHGIAPRLGKDLPVDYKTGSLASQMADNVDLTESTLSGRPSSAVVEANPSNQNSLVKFNDAWQTGQDRYYLRSITAGTDTLYFIQGGVLKKQIGDFIADVGQEKPGTPTLNEIGSGSDFVLNDKPEYRITFVRNIGDVNFARSDTVESEDDWLLKQNGGHTYSQWRTDVTPFPPNPGECTLFHNDTTAHRLVQAAQLLDHDGAEKWFPTANLRIDRPWYPITGNEWEAINEYPMDGHTTYLKIQNCGYPSQPSSLRPAYVIMDSDFSRLNNLLPEYIEVASVNCHYYGTWDGGGSTGTINHSAGFRINSVYRANPVQQQDTMGPTAWRLYTLRCENNPATGQPWTRSEVVNDIDGFGVYLRNHYTLGSIGRDLNAAPEISNMWMEVEYVRYWTQGLHTLHFDLGAGAIGGLDTRIYFDDDRASDSTVGYQVDGSTTGQPNWTPIVTNPSSGDIIDASPTIYQHYRVVLDLESSTDRQWTPIVKAVSIEQEGSDADGRFVDESGPSDPVDITVTATGNNVLVTRPTPADDTFVTHWRIYRLDALVGVYLFAGEAQYIDTTFQDNGRTSGEPAASFFLSDQGNWIEFAKPEELQGIAVDFHAGILFGWKDEDVYWSESGVPDAWPAWYTMKMPHKVKNIVPTAGAVAVLTEGGPIRVDGTHPELMQWSLALGVEPALGSAVQTSRGVVYVSDSGIARFNMVDTEVITDPNFGETWFKKNINLATAQVHENDGKIYLLHDTGVLVRDDTSGAVEWITIPIRFYAGYKEKETGALNLTDGTNIVTLEGDTATTTHWSWQSGELLVKQDGTRQFYSVIVTGYGEVDMHVYIDGGGFISKTIDFSSLRGRTLMLPKNTMGRAIEIQLLASGVPFGYESLISELEIQYSN